MNTLLYFIVCRSCRFRVKVSAYRGLEGSDVHCVERLTLDELLKRKARVMKRIDCNSEYREAIRDAIQELERQHRASEDERVAMQAVLERNSARSECLYLRLVESANRKIAAPTVKCDDLPAKKIDTTRYERELLKLESQLVKVNKARDKLECRSKRSQEHLRLREALEKSDIRLLTLIPESLSVDQLNMIRVHFTPLAS